MDDKERIEKVARFLDWYSVPPEKVLHIAPPSAEEIEKFLSDTSARLRDAASRRSTEAKESLPDYAAVELRILATLVGEARGRADGKTP